jgi:dolichyl-diphosphooligosaccharide--protein glycosyltransferase
MAKQKSSTTAAEAPTDPFAAPEKVVTTTPPSNPLVGWVWLGIATYLVAVMVKIAYRIRMGAIDEFGAVIHEFDPYFNFRATEVRKHSFYYKTHWLCRSLE